jgi:hypothetical protein
MSCDVKDVGVWLRAKERLGGGRFDDFELDPRRLLLDCSDGRDDGFLIRVEVQIILIVRRSQSGDDAQLVCVRSRCARSG